MVHVYPLDDLKEHNTTNTGNICEFNPQIIIEPDSELIVVHNSFDGREAVEWFNEILE